MGDSRYPDKWAYPVDGVHPKTPRQIAEVWIRFWVARGGNSERVDAWLDYFIQKAERGELDKEVM